MSAPKEITIGIFKRSDGEYQYDIYYGEPNDVGDPIDGGVCTGDMQAAINMACGHASEMAQQELKQELDEIRERTDKSKGITR